MLVIPKKPELLHKLYLYIIKVGICKNYLNKNYFYKFPTATSYFYMAAIQNSALKTIFIYTKEP
jgi:hypothetical protein